MGRGLAPGTELDHNTTGKMTLRWIIEGIAIASLPIVTLIAKNFQHTEPVTGLEGLARNAATIGLISIAGDVLGRRGVVPLLIAGAASALAYNTAAEFDLTAFANVPRFNSVENALNEALILSTYVMTGINSYIAKNRGDVMIGFTIHKIAKGATGMLGRILTSKLSNNNDGT